MLSSISALYRSTLNVNGLSTIDSGVNNLHYTTTAFDFLLPLITALLSMRFIAPLSFFNPHLLCVFISGLSSLNLCCLSGPLTVRPVKMFRGLERGGIFEVRGLLECCVLTFLLTVFILSPQNKIICVVLYFY